MVKAKGYLKQPYARPARTDAFRDEMTSQDVISMRKMVLRPPVWTPHNNHAGHLVAVADLVDESFVTLPGLTLQLEIKAPIVVDACLYLFSIMRQQARVRRPIMQLEVAPSHKRTHNGSPPIYGPHLHMGVDEPTAVVDQAVHCGGWASSLKWFLHRARIEPFIIDDPEHVQL